MSRWARLRENATLEGVVLARWHRATIGVVGCGNVGSRFAIEAARSGATVVLFDLEVADTTNLGTQDVRCGQPKARAVAARCNEVRPGSASAYVGDVRHVGVGALARLDLIVDCTDDRSLGAPLTALSNGLGIALLRVAVDGTGKLELGRCLASHAGAGHACQLCGWTIGDLLPRGGRTPCPGATADDRPPTRAGGAIGMLAAGVALLQAQRLIGRRDAGLVLDREVVFDLSDFHLEPMRLRRSPECVSGHEQWPLTRLEGTAHETSLADLFARAREELGTDDPVLELHGHPLFVQALCTCGTRAKRLGTAYVSPGSCEACARALVWCRELSFGRLPEPTARVIGALEPSLLELGLPADGAMVVAHGAGKTRRYVLARSEPSPGAGTPTPDLQEVTP